MFFATGGQHLNADDFFKAKALSLCQGKAAMVEKEKLECLEMLAFDQEAKSVLQAKGLDLNHANEKKFLLPERKLLCKWKGCKVHSSKNKCFTPMRISRSQGRHCQNHGHPKRRLGLLHSKVTTLTSKILHLVWLPNKWLLLSPTTWKNWMPRHAMNCFHRWLNMQRDQDLTAGLIQLLLIIRCGVCIE